MQQGSCWKCGNQTHLFLLRQITAWADQLITLTLTQGGVWLLNNLQVIHSFPLVELYVSLLETKAIHLDQIMHDNFRMWVKKWIGAKLNLFLSSSTDWGFTGERASFSLYYFFPPRISFAFLFTQLLRIKRTWDHRCLLEWTDDIQHPYKWWDMRCDSECQVGSSWGPG